MDKVGARVLIVGPYGDDLPMGLTLPEQLGADPVHVQGLCLGRRHLDGGPGASLQPRHPDPGTAGRCDGGVEAAARSHELAAVCILGLRR
jgi:hypothetical protein